MQRKLMLSKIKGWASKLEGEEAKLHSLLNAEVEKVVKAKKISF